VPSLSSDSMADFIDDACETPSPPPRLVNTSKRAYKRAKNIGEILVDPSPSLPTSSPSVDSYSVFATHALQGLRTLFDNPAAEFKSRQQQDLIIHILSSSADVFGILPTGGGKSAAWQVTAKVRPDVAAIVVIPYVLPLADQLQSNLDKGIPSWKFNGNLDLPIGTQHVFCQPEQYISPEFQR
jgi:superfamily II DNA helicase RecQ